MADWVPDRVPEDIEAERSILATLSAPGMEGRAAAVLPCLTEEDFIHPKHRALFTGLRSLSRRSVEVNAITLADELAKLDLLGIVDGFAGLTELLAAEEVGRPEVLAEILTRRTAQRRLMRIGSKLLRQAAEDELDPDELARGASLEVLQATAPRGGAGDLRQAHEIADEVYHREEEDHGAAVHIPFQRLDLMLGGLHPGNVAVLAARPGMGKTTLALQLALHVAKNRGRVGVWSLEMSQEEVLDRFVAQLRIEGAPKLSPGWTRRRLDDRDRAGLLFARDALRELDLVVCDDPAMTPGKIRASTAQAIAKGRPYHLIVVDYLQLLSDDDPKRASKQTEALRVGAISRALKILAKEMKVPVLLLSQLNREVENRKGAPPQLSDLRDSGAIEQDADQVLFIHRKTVEGVPEDKGLLIAAKNRHGRPGRVFVEFLEGSLTFREEDRGTGDPGPQEPAGSPTLADDWV